jgi:hypothetical protein
VVTPRDDPVGAGPVVCEDLAPLSTTTLTCENRVFNARNMPNLQPMRVTVE